MELIDKLGSERISEIRKSLLKELKEKQSVKDFLNMYGLEESIVDENFADFLDYADTWEHCMYKCEGIHQCTNDKKGWFIDLQYDMNNECLTKPCLRCKYNYMYAHEDNYLINDFARSYLLNGIDEIDLKEEDEQYNKIVEVIKKWIQNENKIKVGFFICGLVGTGKTYLASCITNHFAKEGKKVAAVNMPKLSADLRNNFDVKGYKEDIISKMKKAYILVLDDIGAENVTAGVRDDVLFTVLDYRMLNNKKTIFTSNCKAEDLKVKLANTYNVEDNDRAERIYERIRVMTKEIVLKGESRRK